MPVLNHFPKVSNIIDSALLESLGFNNIPAGYWQIKSTAYGDAQPSTDYLTVIPLVGKGYYNRHTGNTSSGITHYMDMKINGKTSYSATGRKTVDGASYGGMFTDVQSTQFFYPFFFDYNLTATMVGITKQSDRSVNMDDRENRPCVQIYLWLEKVVSTATTNSNMNFPVGSWTMADSASSANDIPLIARVTDTALLNNTTMIGGWNYGTNNPGSGSHYTMYDRDARGIFLPGAYGFDLTATQAARSTVESMSGYTIVKWLHRVA